MEEKEKQSNTGDTINKKQSENIILKPTKPIEDIMDRNKQRKSNSLAKRVESYNYKNGFLASSSINNSNVEEIANAKTEEITKDYQIKIKIKKKNSIFLPILIVLILIIVGGTLIIKSFNNKPVEKFDNSNTTTPEITPPTSKVKETICRKTTDNSNFGYNYIEEKRLYSIDNKLKRFENINRFEYINTVPANINNACYNINQNYKEYEGYIYTCIKKEKTYSYIAEIDLEKLLDKELTFTINSGIEKRTIKENLDDDINEYISIYEEQGYSCDAS
ncbi:MAG: hypothetical protein ACI31M_01910 [Bacilli bacterium]